MGCSCHTIRCELLPHDGGLSLHSGSRCRGRLRVQHEWADSPQEIAQTVLDVIAKSREKIRTQMLQLG